MQISSAPKDKARDCVYLCLCWFFSWWSSGRGRDGFGYIVLLFPHLEKEALIMNKSKAVFNNAPWTTGVGWKLLLVRTSVKPYACFKNDVSCSIRAASNSHTQCLPILFCLPSFSISFFPCLLSFLGSLFKFLSLPPQLPCNCGV